MDNKREHRKTFGDTEHLFSGTLTLGEQKKEGTQISFKAKNRRFFVLRSLSEKFLTMSGYRSIKEYKTAQAGNPYKSVEQIVIAQHAKVHSMHLPSKKHKQSYVLCIIQDKKATYLEVDTSDDLRAWISVIDNAFLRLGWTGPPASPVQPSAQPAPTPSAEAAVPRAPNSRKRTTSLDRVRISSPTTSGSVFELFQPEREKTAGLANAPTRHSCASIETRPPGPNPLDHYDRPKSAISDLGRATEQRAADEGVIGITVPSRDSHVLIESTYTADERVVNLHDYVNVRGEKPVTVCPRPPALPPRSPNHRRGQTCPGVVGFSPGAAPPETETKEEEEEQREQETEDDRLPSSSPPPPPVARPARHSAGERPPRISVTEPLSPLQAVPGSPLLLSSRRFQHLFDEEDEAGKRKVSLPQPLPSPRNRREGVVLPPTHSAIEIPPNSPAQMRKAGSYSNLTLNLSSRPLPSPINGDSFDIHTLRWEMGHTNGFAIALDKHELRNALGLVQIADYVWVAGWRAGKPDVAKKLHVGDQLRQINEQIVVDPSVTKELFERSTADEVIIILRRLPYAKVRYLHRSSDSEGWGLEVEANRILNVSKSGPAADANLTARAQGAFSERLCDWIITELDGEPVSLFSKRDQVKTRMDNAGLDMTLVIQPDDFIKRLKAELEKVRFAHEYFVG